MAFAPIVCPQCHAPTGRATSVLYADKIKTLTFHCTSCGRDWTASQASNMWPSQDWLQGRDTLKPTRS